MGASSVTGGEQGLMCLSFNCSSSSDVWRRKEGLPPVSVKTALPASSRPPKRRHIHICMSYALTLKTGQTRDVDHIVIAVAAAAPAAVVVVLHVCFLFIFRRPPLLTDVRLGLRRGEDPKGVRGYVQAPRTPAPELSHSRRRASYVPMPT